MNTRKINIFRHIFLLMIFWLLLAACSLDSEPSSGTGTSAPTIVAPHPPANVTAKVASTTSITISWGSISGATSYDVYCETGDSSMTKLTTVTGTSYNHTGLKQGITYTYYIAAKNSAGTSDLSSPAKATTTIEKPDVPTSVNASLETTNTSIRVTWNPVANASKYHVYYVEDSSSTSATKNLAGSVNAPTTFYTHPNLKANTMYYYYITAENSAGDKSNYSSPATAKTPNTQPVAPVTYIVTYHANSGNGTTPSPQTVNAGSSITLNSGSGLTRSNYTFGGWNTNISGTGTNYPGSSSFTPTGNITLYAKWNASNAIYTITYDINNGSGSTPVAQTVNAGSSITLNSGSGLTRSNHTFGGWNTNASGTGTNYPASSSFTPTGTITLYAKWNASGTTSITAYTITYHINSGTGSTPAAQTVNAGSSITLNSGSGLSRSGYTFDGWNTNASGTGTNYSAGSSFTPTSNITLYARWNSNILPAPTGVSATAKQGLSILVEWKSVPNAASYDVYYDKDSSRTKTLLKNVGSDTTTYTHIRLSSGSLYRYYITAKNSAGESSDYSASASATASRAGS